MKDTGEPDELGEVRTQSGATATAVADPDGGLRWEVTREYDSHVRHTKKLAHIGHWQPKDTP